MFSFKKLIYLLLFIFSYLHALDSNQDALKLIKSYPNYLKEFKDNNIIFYDNSSMKFDDFDNKKTYEQMLDNPSLKEQMQIKYVKVSDNPEYIPTINESAGRIRFEPFFKKMYGSNQDEVRKNLVKVIWLPKTINKTLLVTSINGVDKKLQDISNELDNLPNNLKSFIDNPSGTFCWRTISKTKRLSTHSYGIAIDINVKYSNYWLWDKNKLVYKNSIPLEIVRIFEKYGFIWGGRWYEYDTMHFEYRPELL